MTEGEYRRVLIERLCERRRFLCLSRQRVAAEIGISPRRLYDFELGYADPSLSQLVSWLRALGMQAVFKKLSNKGGRRPRLPQVCGSIRPADTGTFMGEYSA